MKTGALADAAATVQEELKRDNVFFHDKQCLRARGWSLNVNAHKRAHMLASHAMPDYGDPRHPDNLQYHVRAVLTPTVNTLELCVRDEACGRAMA